MAGSFGHCAVGKSLELRDEPLLDNLGDAGGAIEEYHFMVKYLSGGDALKIKEASDAYYKSVNPSYEPKSFEEWIESFVDEDYEKVEE